MLERYDYDYEYDDKYCSPDTKVLKNKLGITDDEELHTAEREITSMWLVRLKAEPVVGKFDFAHLKRIHRKIFSDIYTWAGQCRTVDISKGNVFCRAMFIETYAGDLFAGLVKENWLITAERSSVPDRLAYYLSEINVLHPFREGNGRTQRLFIEYLGLVGGFHVDFSGVSADEMIRASADAFAQDYGRLNEMFERICTPISRSEQEKAVGTFFGVRSAQLRMLKATRN
ncbi:MAG: Fic family protein [Ruminiclostridium sp.]|nr:Fic family protein [Ruminiclostridium sp.]